MSDRPAARGTARYTTSESLAEAADLPLTRLFERLIDRLGPDAVFGEPVRHGDTTVIPVAVVRTGFGFGGGRGGEASEEGSGVGGGAGVRVTPRGYIQMRDDEVRFRRIRRFNPVGVAVGFVLATGLFAFFAPIWRA